MINIKVIFQDQYLMVLDKPSGVTVNRSDSTKSEQTVQDFIEENLLSLENVLPESDFYQRAGIVHRIDKETSGILLVAKNQKSFENLQAQFKERVVGKTYIALVHGNMLSDTGEIVVPVGRLPWNRKRFGVLAGGKEASTKYKVIERFEKGGGFTLLSLNPKTGRTHQIRVHLKYAGHPIFADYLYAGRKTARADRQKLQRVFLHAREISLNHPATGKRIDFESPLPADLSDFLENLRD